MKKWQDAGRPYLKAEFFLSSKGKEHSRAVLSLTGFISLIGGFKYSLHKWFNYFVVIFEKRYFEYENLTNQKYKKRHQKKIKPPTGPMTQT